MKAMAGLRIAFVLAVAFIMIPHPAYSPIIYQGENPKQIALTFDDGPSFRYSMKVLDILKREKVKATFFIVGQKAEEYPEILKMMADDGHELGNHTYYHSRITTLSEAKLLAELKDTSLAIKKVTGKRVVFFRPPFGDFTRDERITIEKAGYKMVLWSVHADDFYHLGWGMRTPKSIENRVIRFVTGGDIILAHDDSEQIVEALPVIIETLKKEGYSFVTMSELVGPKRAAR